MTTYCNVAIRTVPEWQLYWEVSMKKFIIYVLIGIILAILVYVSEIAVGGAVIGGLFKAPIGKEKMETIFAKDHDLLTIITNYLANSNNEI